MRPLGNRLGPTLAVALLGLALAACAAPSPSPSSTSTTAAVPSASSAISTTFADGIPSVLDGQPVLRPAAALARAATATDATPFLLGGWERPPAPLPCPTTTSESVLDLSGCDRPSLAEASGTEFDQSLGITGTTEVLLAALPDSLPLQDYAPVVLVVHVHDARCQPGDTQCLAAFVVDRLAWSDDIPAAIDGQPVLSIYQGMMQATTALTSQPFLIGGWFAGFALSCPAPVDTPTSSLVPWCDGIVLTDLPFEVYRVLDDTQAAFITPIYLPDTSGGPMPRSGRVVYRVHVHDPSAVDCPTSLLARCQVAVVVDGLVWQGLPPITTVGPGPSSSPTGAVP